MQGHAFVGSVYGFELIGGIVLYGVGGYGVCVHLIEQGYHLLIAATGQELDDAEQGLGGAIIVQAMRFEKIPLGFQPLPDAVATGEIYGGHGLALYSLPGVVPAAGVCQEVDQLAL